MAVTSPDLVSYLDRRLGPHYGKGPEYEWPCPACLDRLGSESSKPKLRMNLDKGVGFCFRCEFRTTLERLFRFLNRGILRVEEVRLLRRTTAVPTSLVDAVRAALHPTAASVQRLRPVPLPEGCFPLGEATRKLAALAPAFTYIAERGVSVEQAEAFEVYYAPGGRYAHRLVFPVRQAGEVVYFTSRYCGVHRVKALNPPAQPGFFSRETCLLHFDAVVGYPVVAVAEGPFSCMALPYAVALMGKTASEEHVRLLENLVAHGLNEVVIALDADAGKAIDMLYAKLDGRLPKVTVLPLDHGDPHDRRDEIDLLLARRGPPTLAARCAARMQSSKNGKSGLDLSHHRVAG